MFNKGLLKIRSEVLKKDRHLSRTHYEPLWEGKSGGGPTTGDITAASGIGGNWSSERSMRLRLGNEAFRSRYELVRVGRRSGRDIESRERGVGVKEEQLME